VEGRKGGGGDGTGEVHKLFVFRQSKSTLYSLLLRAQTGWGEESRSPLALYCLGEKGRKKGKH